ncbi:DUF3551 domain-containing protein [Bradyrhizobium liaoningense]|uniref:DUF3551 domain-containing protein n=1 Tax=Bradyrhizobium liaoningense TaxID=43992 RepID=UPI001BA8C3B9|nr:DUF3551 domain-containing protein [Bradyrhizobium liaoningense]MBR0740534.1 DUF3551 domain-containing protein [Bradyrhizobium liaoningense]MBR0904694.1 DUF3551 domain-containing protein [Bradyrhizobium liaoningense]
MTRLLLAIVSVSSVLLSTASMSAAAERHYRYGNAAPGVANGYCLQGRIWGYPGNCQFSTYQQCMASASGTDAYCGVNPAAAFAYQRDPRGQWYPR